MESKIDFQALAAGDFILIKLFGLLKKMFCDEGEPSQVRAISHLCAQRDEFGWYTPVGQELLEIIARHYCFDFSDSKSKDQADEEVELNELATSLFWQLERTINCIDLPPPPLKSERPREIDTK